MKLTPELYRRIVGAKLYMDENFHESIDLDDISRSALLSRFHFHRLFTRVYKITPHQYLTRKRLNKARDLLAKEEITVTEVCNSVGFESIGSFSTLFKKEMGYPPVSYRNMEWLRQQQVKEQPKQFIPHCFIEGFHLDK
jgi:AraC-like DNA-binding protein